MGGYLVGRDQRRLPIINLGGGGEKEGKLQRSRHEGRRLLA